MGRAFHCVSYIVFVTRHCSSRSYKPDIWDFPQNDEDEDGDDSDDDNNKEGGDSHSIQEAIEYLLCIMHCSKHLIDIIAFNLFNHLI